MISKYGILFLVCLFGIQCSSEKQKGVNTVNQTIAPEVIQVKSQVQMPEYINIDYVMGKFAPEGHDKFSKIDQSYADRSGRYMHTEAYQAFIKMHAKAKTEGIDLKIKSAARNFDYQKGIWERKWNGATLLEGQINAVNIYPKAKDRAEAILKYSSMPGSSRHHWGTDIDINAFTNSYFEKGQGAKEYVWLQENAASFGFCQPYTPKGTSRPNGYEEEKWHWSYLPIANHCMQVAKTKLKNSMLTNFEGSDQAITIDILNNYILGINPSCQPN